MTQILAFSGRKQSGKSTLANFIHGYQLKSYNLIDAFEIADTGELIVETSVREEGGKISKGKGMIDITRTDIEFAVWAMDNVWPFVKHYAFATALKEVAIGLFGIEKELVYGTDDQKNQLTSYKWEDMPVKIKGKSGFMTGREFIQYFGTDICRKIYPDIWTDRTIKDIEAEESNLAVVSDARFENEIKAIQNAGGKVIRLTRQIPGEDKHESEIALDNYSGFDAIIDTQNLNIEASCQQLINILNDWSWFNSRVDIPPPEKPTRKQNTMSIK
jgi:hypothetical protein